MSVNQMTVSLSSLLNINRKITDTRKYRSNLINTVGNVTISESRAHSFDSSSYLYKSDLAFTESEISISCSANFSKAKGVQTLYELTGEGTTFSLQFHSNTKISIFLNSEEIISFENIEWESNTKFSSIFKISKTSCKILICTGSKLLDKSYTFNDTLNLTNLNKIIIGNSLSNLENYWVGSVDLSVFSIYEGNNKLVYTPSTGYPITFSKILISDGEFPLSNESVPIVNHIFEYPIEEITRSGGNLLLTTLVDEEAKLIIKEIGLYATTDEGETLFSIINGLNINKGKGVPYSLVFTLNLYINIVNVKGWPNTESFYLEQPEYCLYKILNGIKNLHLYIFTNLERLVSKNALMLGYNREQVFYRLQQDNYNLMTCCYALQTYQALLTKLNNYPYTVVDFFNFPHVTKSAYEIKDICDFNNIITFNLETFECNKDNIDFSGDFTLSLRAFLKNSEPKVILAKTDLNNDPYIFIYYINNTIYVTLFTKSKVITLQEDISHIHASVEDYSLLITVEKSEDSLALYLNNEKADEFQGQFGTFKNASRYFLTNIANEEILTTLYNNVNLGLGITLEEFIDKLQENTDLYLSDIFAFDGSLSDKGIKFLTNQTDTNYSLNLQ